MRTAVPGVATGLAWTPVGGDILFIEAARTPGRGGLQLTGQLGEVMRESVQAAFTLVKGHADELGIEHGLVGKTDIHVHVPAGATPKDGPSAGVAMYTALVSLLTGRTVRSDTAMTGEISLRGLVLPVGGIKEKVIAAARAGLKRVMLPARNKRDYDDIPKACARNSISFGSTASIKRSRTRWSQRRRNRRNRPKPSVPPRRAPPRANAPTDYFSVFTYAITSARSFASGTMIAMLVPGTSLPGLAMNASSFASSQTMPDDLSAGEYITPGTVPALRPTTPAKLGPIITGPLGMWHVAQRANTALPFIASPASAACACASPSTANAAAARMSDFMALPWSSN